MKTREQIEYEDSEECFNQEKARLTNVWASQDARNRRDDPVPLLPYQEAFARWAAMVPSEEFIVGAVIDGVAVKMLTPDDDDVAVDKAKPEWKPDERPKSVRLHLPMRYHRGTELFLEDGAHTSAGRFLSYAQAQDEAQKEEPEFAMSIRSPPAYITIRGRGIRAEFIQDDPLRPDRIQRLDGWPRFLQTRCFWKTDQDP